MNSNLWRDDTIASKAPLNRNAADAMQSVLRGLEHKEKRTLEAATVRSLKHEWHDWNVLLTTALQKSIKSVERVLLCVAHHITLAAHRLSLHEHPAYSLVLGEPFGKLPLQTPAKSRELQERTLGLQPEKRQGAHLQCLGVGYACSRIHSKTKINADQGLL